ncbi:NAD(P)/FAD-dependent oxidoreductase [Microbacteriaceae bacterium VKM Ac-2854]|nr:NAD(P)/FAD-dependent oxidoreductase [Microbacteriaceae bacterium VKM Ac-2854]
MSTVTSPATLHFRADEPPPTTVDTLIVGAGFAGLGLAIRLTRAGETDFLLLERAGDVGGTWRENTYPDVACDIPSHLYSYSFRPKPDWSAYFAPGAEIQEYLRDAARDEGILPRLRLGTEVLDMRWDAQEQHWNVTTTRGDFVCRALILCAGRLSEPRIPAAPGLESFPGPLFHSARWQDAELAGKRVGIVGSGASAVQLLPHLARTAASVVLFQRSAPYVVPRGNSSYSAAQKRAFQRLPDAVRRLRESLFWGMERGFAGRLATPGFIDRLRAEALGHLAAQVADPQLRAVLTPDYEIGCKRVLLSDDYYPALARAHVSVVPAPLAHVDGATVHASDGSAHELDVLILATGFQATRPPFARLVFGRDGVSLAEHWADGMRAYASTAVHGFPNLFVINGPNASLGHNSAVYMIEAQIDYVLAALAAGPVLEVSAEAEEAYVAELDALAADTVWTNGGCGSWYVDSATKRLTLIWPDFAFSFRDRIGRFDPAPFLRPTHPDSTLPPRAG